MPITRRSLLSGLTATIAAPALAQRKLRRFSMLLNTSASGPQAWFYLAQDRGYLAEEGLEIAFTPGAGAYTAAPRMHASGFDFGYGDVNALIELAAATPGSAPVGVYAMFNASPSTIAVSAAGPVRAPKDLEGRRVVGHSSDVALRTFGVFCAATGIDRAKVAVGSFGGGFREQVEALHGASDLHGVFGYVSTIASAMSKGGPDGNGRLHHLRFADHAPDLYGSVIMASRRVLDADRSAVAGLVRAINRGVRDAVRNPEAGIDAVLRRAPYADRRAEMLRLKTTLAIEMAHPEGRRLGIGAIDPARFGRSIAQMTAAANLAARPSAAEVFTLEFLPPTGERVTSLAKS